MYHMGKFKVPNEKERQKALGAMAGSPYKIKKAFTNIERYFEPIIQPRIYTKEYM